jgi:hypothetical protein
MERVTWRSKLVSVLCFSLHPHVIYYIIIMRRRRHNMMVVGLLAYNQGLGLLMYSLEYP